MTAVTNTRPGRNEPCHCGSGRKYKHCCLAKDDAQAAAARAKAAEDEGAQPAEPAAGEPASSRKHHTDQPWRPDPSRGFIPRPGTPRKAGDS
jgi:hypothetical protein